MAKKIRCLYYFLLNAVIQMMIEEIQALIKNNANASKDVYI